MKLEKDENKRDEKQTKMAPLGATSSSGVGAIAKGGQNVSECPTTASPDGFSSRGHNGEINTGRQKA